MSNIQDMKKAMAWFNALSPEEKAEVKKKAGLGADKITAYWRTLQ